MDKSYSVVSGGLRQANTFSTIFRYHCWHFIRFGKLSIKYGAIYLLTLFITSYVFHNCVLPRESDGGFMIILSDCISLGSIFATFGSAIIAVMSLTSTQHWTSFQEKVGILNDEFTKQGTNSWKRWEFLPRYSREPAVNGKHNYYFLENVSLSFATGKGSISVPIPTVKKDFFDLPILRSYLLLLTHKKEYNKYVQENGIQNDILIWNCLNAMYGNIIAYHISQFIMSIGIAFVINSIIYAFFYMRLYNIM